MNLFKNIFYSLNPTLLHFRIYLKIFNIPNNHTSISKLKHVALVLHVKITIDTGEDRLFFRVPNISKAYKSQTLLMSLN